MSDHGGRRWQRLPVMTVEKTDTAAGTGNQEMPIVGIAQMDEALNQGVRFRSRVRRCETDDR